MLKPYDVEQAAAESSEASLMQKSPRPPRKPKVKKLFVLDTNVLMHDPTSLLRFEEHDVYLPIGTLRDWEQGRCEPDQPARAYLSVIAHDPEGVRRALARTR